MGLIFLLCALLFSMDFGEAEPVAAVPSTGNQVRLRGDTGTFRQQVTILLLARANATSARDTSAGAAAG